MTSRYTHQDDDACEKDAFYQAPHPDALNAITQHYRSVEAWVKATPADRAQKWRDVEAAWRRCQAAKATSDAGRLAGNLMRAEAKLRSIA
jgi:hypothetical protein